MPNSWCDIDIVVVVVVVVVVTLVVVVVVVVVAIVICNLVATPAFVAAAVIVAPR